MSRAFLFFSYYYFFCCLSVVWLTVPGFPVESSTLSEKKVCLCVAVECREMHMDGRGRGESTRDLDTRRRHRVCGEKTDPVCCCCC